jgi:hypothetical protein
MNPRIGSFYAIGGIVLCLAGAYYSPAGMLLFWPGLSLLTVASGYFGMGPAVIGKRDGRHPLWARLFHLFYLAGHEVSRRIYARQCSAWDELVPGLLIGRQLDADEAGRLQGEGVTAVLDLTAEFGEPAALRKLNYLNIPVLDLTRPSHEQLQTAIEFISGNIQSGKVYLHCKIGYSRTAAVAGAYLVHSGRATDPDDALRLLSKARPSIVIRPEAREAIEGK